MLKNSLIPTENKNELSINPDISRRFKNAMFQISVKYYDLSASWPKHEITNQPDRARYVERDELTAPPKSHRADGHNAVWHMIFIICELCPNKQQSMTIETIPHSMFIYTIFPFFLKCPCLIILMSIVLRPKINRRHQFFVFLRILTEHQLVILMHMSRPRDMQRTYLTSYQCPNLYPPPSRQKDGLSMPFFSTSSPYYVKRMG